MAAYTAGWMTFVTCRYTGISTLCNEYRKPFPFLKYSMERRVLNSLCVCPACGWGTSFPPFSPLSSSFVFLLFPFFSFDHFTCFLLLFIPFLSTIIVPLRFEVGGRGRRQNLGLVCCVYFVLSGLLS